MKILVVSPVPTYATWDVFDGHVSGLRANGVDVIPFNYSKVWNMFVDFKEFAEVTGRVEYNAVNHALLAGDRIVLSAITLDVDLIHFVAPMHVNPATLRVLKQYTRIKTSAYFTECPYDDGWALDMAELFDYCFVCDKTSEPVFGERNPHSKYVGHSYDPERHQKNGHTTPRADVVFVGTNFPSRVKFLEETNWDGIDLELHGIMRLGGASCLDTFVKTNVAIPNEQALALYRGARIGLQMHRRDGYHPEDAARGKRYGRGLVGAKPIANLNAHSLGPRSYELAACGVFQVCDEGRAELREVFGDTVPTYTTPESLRAVVKTYLDDPVRREEQARAQHEAIKPYTFEARMRSLLEAL